MRRLNNRVVELTMMEMLVNEVFNLLLDQGYHQVAAVDHIIGKWVSPGLKTPTPVLDSVMTPEFQAWLEE